MALAPSDLARTIEELEGEIWGAPEFDSHVVGRSHQLRRVPIGELSVEDLRLLVGQQVGLPWVLERAVQVLDTNPLAEGDFYQGDLLASVLSIPPDELQRHPQALERLRAITERVTPLLRQRTSAEPHGAESDLLSRISRHFPSWGAA